VHRRGDTVEHALDVRVNHPMPLVNLEKFAPRTRHQPGIVDHDINAPEFLHGGIDRFRPAPPLHPKNPAVKATNRKNLIIAGVSTEVCVAFLALSVVKDGYGAYAVIDASGTWNAVVADVAVAADGASGRGASDLARGRCGATTRLASSGGSAAR